MTPAAHALALAILWLAPHLSASTIQNYARIIDREAHYVVDPLLIIAIAHVESSWNPSAASATHDYGLLQIHVSATSNPELLGHERVLYDPIVNVHYAAATLHMWRNYHARECTPRRRAHPWYAHYGWGRRVRNLDWALKIRDLHHELRRRFATAEAPES